MCNAAQSEGKVTKIAPVFNRAVLFRTSGMPFVSLHHNLELLEFRFSGSIDSDSFDSTMNFFPNSTQTSTIPRVKNGLLRWTFSNAALSLLHTCVPKICSYKKDVFVMMSCDI